MSDALQALTWTQTPPSEPGWYWFKNRAGETGIVEVDAPLIERAIKQYGYFLADQTDFAMWWSDKRILEPAEEDSDV